MESVNKWFENGCGYWPGIELYAGLPWKKPMLLRNLRKKESHENLAKLKYELEPLRKPAAPEPAPVAIAGPKPSIATTVVPEKKPVYFQNLPKELRPVLLQANNYHREACMLKAELNDVPAENEQEALGLIIRINALLRRNALCWEQIDHWERHGKIAPVPAAQTKQLTPAAQWKRQALLFSSISKLRKRLQKNADQLAATTDQKTRTRLEKNVAKQSANLLKQETELSELTALIENEQ